MSTSTLDGESLATPLAAPTRSGPAPAPEKPRKRIKELEAIVVDVVKETHDAATLVLFTGNERLDYEAGHFLTIDAHQFEELERFLAYFEHVKGRREPPRAYSMSSAPSEKYLAVTVKEEPFIKGTTRYPPLLSPLLVKGMARGQRVKIVGFTGPYVMPADIAFKTDHLVHLVAGSGSVPNFAILKHALAFVPQLRHTFIYANKTWRDVIFRRQLDELRERHPDRLRVVHALSREDNPEAHGPDARKGRISAALLQEVVPDVKTCRVFACGPAVGKFERAAAKEKGEEVQPRFLETALAALQEIGVPEAHLTTEAYG